MNFKNTFQEYLQILESGQMLAVIDRFYSDDIRQYENNQLFLDSKTDLIAHEEKNLSRVTELEVKIHQLILDEEKQWAWGEMLSRFTSRQGQKLQLQEAFFQKWKEGKIIEQKFYYKEVVNF